MNIEELEKHVSAVRSIPWRIFVSTETGDVSTPLFALPFCSVEVIKASYLPPGSYAVQDADYSATLYLPDGRVVKIPLEALIVEYGRRIEIDAYIQG